MNVGGRALVLAMLTVGTGAAVRAPLSDTTGVRGRLSPPPALRDTIAAADSALFAALRRDRCRSPSLLPRRGWEGRLRYVQLRSHLATDRPRVADLARRQLRPLDSPCGWPTNQCQLNLSIYSSRFFFYTWRHTASL